MASFLRATGPFSMCVGVLASACRKQMKASPLNQMLPYYVRPPTSRTRTRVIEKKGWHV